MVNYIGGGKRNHLDNSPSKYGRDGNPFRKDFIKMVDIVHIFNGLRRCMFPYIGNFIIPTDFHIFQRGRSTTSQTIYSLVIKHHLRSSALRLWIWRIPPRRTTLPPKLYMLYRCDEAGGRSPKEAEKAGLEAWRIF